MRNLNTNPYLEQQMVQDKNSSDQTAVFPFFAETSGLNLTEFTSGIFICKVFIAFIILEHGTINYKNAFQ